MYCGIDSIIFAGTRTNIVAQNHIICYYKALRGNKALSKERKRHGCFEGVGGDCRCGDARLSIVDGEQLSSDRRQAEFGWQTAELPRVFVRGNSSQ